MGSESWIVSQSNLRLILKHSNRSLGQQPVSSSSSSPSSSSSSLSVVIRAEIFTDSNRKCLWQHCASLHWNLRVCCHRHVLLLLRERLSHFSSVPPTLNPLPIPFTHSIVFNALHFRLPPLLFQPPVIIHWFFLLFLFLTHFPSSAIHFLFPVIVISGFTPCFYLLVLFCSAFFFEANEQWIIVIIDLVDYLSVFSSKFDFPKSTRRIIEKSTKIWIKRQQHELRVICGRKTNRTENQTKQIAITMTWQINATLITTVNNKK